MWDGVLAFLKNGGWGLLVFVALFSIRLIIAKTKTKVDDAILDGFVRKGVSFAYDVMPKDSTVDWIKFTCNVLKVVNDSFTKVQVLPDAGVLDQVKSLIATITEGDEYKSLLKTA